LSDIPLEDETRSVEEIIDAAKNVINSWSPQFTAEEVLAVSAELEQVRKKLADAPHDDRCNLYPPAALRYGRGCNCWKEEL
jgi:hypothetical protein